MFAKRGGGAERWAGLDCDRDRADRAWWRWGTPSNCKCLRLLCVAVVEINIITLLWKSNRQGIDQRHGCRREPPMSLS